MQRWVTFDCYGTLIDWDAGLAAELRRLWPDEDIEDLLSDYHRVEPLIQQHGALSCRAVLSRSVRAIAGMRELSVPPGGNSWLADSVPRSWPPFPEVATALEALCRAGPASAQTGPGRESPIDTVNTDIPARTVADRVTAEIDNLLPQSKGQLGVVAQCLRDGISDRRAMVDAGAAANPAAVGNILASIRANRDGSIPDSVPTVASLAASSTRSFLSYLLPKK